MLKCSKEPGLGESRQTTNISLNISREAFGSLDNQGIKGLLKEVGEMAEKQNEFVPSVFIVGSVVHVWQRKEVKCI